MKSNHSIGCRRNICLQLSCQPARPATRAQALGMVAERLPATRARAPLVAVWLAGYVSLWLQCKTPVMHGSCCGLVCLPGFETMSGQATAAPPLSDLTPPPQPAAHGATSTMPRAPLPASACPHCAHCACPTHSGCGLHVAALRPALALMPWQNHSATVAEPRCAGRLGSMPLRAPAPPWGLSLCAGSSLSWRALMPPCGRNRHP